MRRLAILLILLLAAGCVETAGFKGSGGKAVWSAPDSVSGNFTLASQGEAYSTYKVSFKNLGADVSALYVLPSEPKAGAVVIPGALVKKESMVGLYSLLASKGVASLVLDVRGVGETRGGESEAVSVETFATGKPAEAHKIVSDIIFAQKLLRSRAELGGKPVVIVGESNGGRYGIIAASQTGAPVLVISSAGYGMGEPLDARTRYYKSIDPDNYVANVTRLAMVQPNNDPAIPLYYAERTFAICGGEKRFWGVDSSVHGFSSDVETQVGEAVEFVLS